MSSDNSKGTVASDTKSMIVEDGQDAEQAKKE